MKKILFSLFLTASPLCALLPPLYQSVEEYTRLLKDPELEKAIGSGQVIESIERTATGFIVKGNRSSVEAKIVYEPQNHPGKAHFHFIITNPKP